MLPDGYNAPAPFTDDQGITWIYDGQERMSAEADEASEPTWVWEDGTKGARLSLIEQLYDTLMTDRYGRRWIPIDIDETKVLDEIAAYDDLVDADAELAAELPGLDALIEDTAPGFTGWSLEQNLGYVTSDCSGDGEDDTAIWGSESRTRANPMNGEDEKTVFIVVQSAGTSSKCSGVFVDDDTILTAAHCLYNKNGVQLDFSGSGQNATGGACTRENLQTGADCAAITSIRRPGGYDPTSDPVEYDYGLFNIDENNGYGNWMAISAASDATLTAATHFTTGTPRWLAGTCTANATASGTIDNNYAGRFAYSESVSGAVNAGTWYGTHLDSAKGQSGSGIWYFPTSAHYITMVMSRHKWHFTDDYVGGPKGPDLRSWAIANM